MVSLERHQAQHLLVLLWDQEEKEEEEEEEDTAILSSLTSFYGSLYLALTCSVLVLPEVYRIMDCSWRSLQEWFPYATLLGSTADTCTASVYEAFGNIFTQFLRVTEL